MKISGADIQDPLVSGTNIKTINSNSILGSGNLTISGGAGGIHIPVAPVSGRVYSLKLNGNSLNTSTTISNGMRLLPFLPLNTITSSLLSINVTAASAGSLLKILVFSNVGGSPSQKLYESSQLDCSTTGIKSASASLTFTAGTTYWIGIIANQSGPTLSAYPTGTVIPIAESAVAGTSQWLLGATAYSFSSIPSTVTSSDFSTASANAPAVFITAA